ncbi:tRNA (adenosine(37)-N6)-threonylcarbamoyltransferase complex ATPase subunit type 1 TsaE [Marinoscillum sp. MHG1-6]|uniref:tRNA (adenosine(37)-N6)-threonylcarbamoyltransferase complex ATPase subunit type 1 TsaE n=1 Tax=Marinoscillum sp. MHG1-6 TaxID=2959627 RepID=UPI0021577320|nr:tRNA (adenosine(37)-N6)-threonylcarbamoyltransferase complex ATPase subunit type 1 TsaE [Marinoscillum sp. MHG1-6]
MRKFEVRSLTDLKEPALYLIELLDSTPVVCFYGEMGAGKTTFIKEVCELLGVEDNTSSPTFSIVNEYLDEHGNSVYHFDFYRIKGIREAQDVGAEEYFYSGDVCFIEWPELINELIPGEHLEINIKLVGENNREIIINSPG